MAKSKVITGETVELKIEIDQETCIGCGTCSVIAPDSFELDKNFKSCLKSPIKDNKKTILEAAQSCAVDAIKVIDNRSGKQLWPES
ncbi:MAG: hypothetical protein A3D24_04690 [Candidatus Blackburnbacteria bacterium RIFCSPHIGHO2_02_FULL_39_13]|uniref:Ferredoxin n=1 Tax=Candidatus Blackburnbacteria bacterium RIFCSPLOWO2_01_FULL_40_20 TaxID=1797519 RepID=A0A1G1VBE3_9BACT|nr:MAG: hypothetical protein UT38_C0007G0010 [Microgenomates group bacterium GW2011_GWA2_39_19]OGY07087.1 MAG: hypothetical protein A2694_03360 [Candidatus Blackburnbacteria bacterium RIFCSPHIGHO2_01_FULL_40_17]OGY08909.1 MAG: hypothetical protein A3D24_04690 [Candidatus Blackburnbacteria bacterium RIFCSPHIGHO2_02_FULL_39_13]OGY12745.1 MAG: hypothetical protein A3A77_00455 [Candidatus Blackburnbacteria bacterium RIFCSPLOWO2_01_FULL_40_20]OGY15275.1 MAG: hypothetical protein A3I52_01045 [Candida